MAFETSVSGIKASQQRLDVQANNVANVNTNEYKKERALGKDMQPSGTRNEFDMVDTQGPLVEDNTPTGRDIVELSNVELAEELPNTTISLRATQANAAVIKTEDEMLGSLLDMKA